MSWRPTDAVLRQREREQEVRAFNEFVEEEHTKMTAKFKVGDRVRAKDDLALALPVSATLSKGREGVVERAVEAYPRELYVRLSSGLYLYFYEDELELVKEEKVPENQGDATPIGTFERLLLDVYKLMLHSGTLGASLRTAEVEVVGHRDGKAIVLTVTEDEPF